MDTDITKLIKKITIANKKINNNRILGLCKTVYDDIEIFVNSQNNLVENIVINNAVFYNRIYNVKTPVINEKRHHTNDIGYVYYNSCNTYPYSIPTRDVINFLKSYVFHYKTIFYVSNYDKTNTIAENIIIYLPKHYYGLICDSNKLTKFMEKVGYYLVESRIYIAGRERWFQFSPYVE